MYWLIGPRARDLGLHGAAAAAAAAAAATAAAAAAAAIAITQHPFLGKSAREFTYDEGGVWTQVRCAVVT
jgi:hypothetical protein